MSDLFLDGGALWWYSEEEIDSESDGDCERSLEFDLRGTGSYLEVRVFRVGIIIVPLLPTYVSTFYRSKVVAIPRIIDYFSCSFQNSRSWSPCTRIKFDSADLGRREDMVLTIYACPFKPQVTHVQNTRRQAAVSLVVNNSLYHMKDRVNLICWSNFS